MSDALCQLIPSKEEREKLDKKKKEFLKESKKIKQTPSEKMQDDLEPIINE